MKKFIRTPRALLLGVSALAVVLVGAGVASGTIGANKPNIYWGCVPKDGRIKLVYPGSKCKKGERFIKWHQTGPPSATVVNDGQQGPKGDNGAQGSAGSAGPQGPAGLKGDAGVNGAKGADGAAGPKGDKGDTGAAGLDGAAGVDGLNGANGVNGVDGTPGEPGAPGAPGAKGDKGDPGEPGAPGAKGDKGDPGAPGAPGALGAKGDKGDAGASASSSYERVPVKSPVDSNNSTKSVTAVCPGGKVVVGGGYEVSAAIDKVAGITVVTNRPVDNNQSWMVSAVEAEPNVGQWGITAYAICVS